MANGLIRRREAAFGQVECGFMAICPCLLLRRGEISGRRAGVLGKVQMFRAQGQVP